MRLPSRRPSGVSLLDVLASLCEPCGCVIPSEGVSALTTSTRFAKSLEPDARLSLRSVLDRLKAAAIGLALIATLVAGFIMTALFVIDLLDMR